MQVNRTTNTPQFGNFYNATSMLEDRIMWNRTLVSVANDTMWVIKANNKNEAWEKARRFATVLTLTFLTPVLTLPFSNRLAMKYGTKLTKSFWSDNHKLMHISNKYLTESGEKGTKLLKEGMDALKKDYTYSPLEHLYAAVKGKKLDNKNKSDLNFDEILEKCGGDYEVLRKKLINAKNGVLASDMLFTSLAFGSVGFINNRITKKQTGQSGFSAEMNMADKSIVEKRADNYEKTWKKRYAAFVLGTLAVGLGVPLALKKGMCKQNISKFTKNISPEFDYNDGMWMKRLPLLLGVALMGHTGTMLATRNKTELKDNVIRYFTSDAIFFGGDILLSSVFANASDRLFKTKLTKPTDSKFGKIFPHYKSLKEIANEVDAGKIKKSNKWAATGLYWLNLAIITASLGLGVSSLVNAITRRDVQKDVEKLSGKKPDNNPKILSKEVQSSKLKSQII